MTSDDRADGFAIFTANELHSVVTNSKVFQPTHSILTMMPSSQPISSRKLLLLLSLGTPLLSESYQQHLPELKWGAGALSYAQRDRLSKTSRTLFGRPSASYDLGLGKNQPIKSSKTSKPATKLPRFSSLSLLQLNSTFVDSRLFCALIIIQYIYIFIKFFCLFK